MLTLQLVLPLASFIIAGHMKKQRIYLILKIVNLSNIFSVIHVKKRECI